MELWPQAKKEAWQPHAWQAWAKVEGDTSKFGKSACGRQKELEVEKFLKYRTKEEEEEDDDEEESEEPEKAKKKRNREEDAGSLRRVV